MSCYMLVSYWMDSESWTMLRRCLMFANIPMVVFFGTANACNPSIVVVHKHASLRVAMQGWCLQGSQNTIRWDCPAKLRR